MFEADLVPGPASARLLAPRTPDKLADDALVDAIQGWERLASWAAARQLEAIAELARRRSCETSASRPGHVDAGHPGLPGTSEFAVDEVAAALRLSRSAADARLQVAMELVRLHGTAQALRTGAIDLPRARVTAEATAALDDAVAAAVEARVLPRAADQTVGQLRASLSRAVASVDAAGAELRLERALTCRRVTVTPSPDGTAELYALLSADGAAAVYAAVDAVARAADAADGRGVDQRRADALVDLVMAPVHLAARRRRCLRWCT